MICSHQMMSQGQWHLRACVHCMMCGVLQYSLQSKSSNHFFCGDKEWAWTLPGGALAPAVSCSMLPSPAQTIHPNKPNCSPPIHSGSTTFQLTNQGQAGMMPIAAACSPQRIAITAAREMRFKKPKVFAAASPVVESKAGCRRLLWLLE